MAMKPRYSGMDGYKGYKGLIEGYNGQKTADK